MAKKRLDRLMRALELCISGFLSENYSKYYRLACAKHSDQSKTFYKTLELVRARQDRAKYEYYLWFKESFKSSYKYHRCDDIEALVDLLSELEKVMCDIKKYFKFLNELVHVSEKNISATVDHTPYTKLCEVVSKVNKVLCEKERNMRHRYTGYSSLSESIASKIIDNKNINIDGLSDAFWLKIKLKIALINKNRNEFYNNKAVNPKIEELTKQSIILNQQLEIQRDETFILKKEVESYKSIVLGMG